MTHTPQVGTPERRGAGHWYVSSGQFGYVVKRVGGRWTCCCLSFRWRKTGTCKHIAAVRQSLAQSTEVFMG
jgi:hypothetical protein